MLAPLCQVVSPSVLYCVSARPEPPVSCALSVIVTGLRCQLQSASSSVCGGAASPLAAVDGRDDAGAEGPHVGRVGRRQAAHVGHAADLAPGRAAVARRPDALAADPAVLIVEEPDGRRHAEERQPAEAGPRGAAIGRVQQPCDTTRVLGTDRPAHVLIEELQTADGVHAARQVLAGPRLAAVDGLEDDGAAAGRVVFTGHPAGVVVDEADGREDGGVAQKLRDPGLAAVGGAFERRAGAGLRSQRVHR